MPTYRMYRLDGAGRISGADWIDAADDEAARGEARAKAGSTRYELWQKERLIERSAPG